MIIKNILHVNNKCCYIEIIDEISKKMRLHFIFLSGSDRVIFMMLGMGRLPLNLENFPQKSHFSLRSKKKSQRIGSNNARVKIGLALNFIYCCGWIRAPFLECRSQKLGGKTCFTWKSKNKLVLVSRWKILKLVWKNNMWNNVLFWNHPLSVQNLLPLVG